MPLQRFSENDAGWRATRLACAALGAMLLVACASGPAVTDADAPGGPAAASNEDVPPKVQTLYEQAVSAMAGGDPLEAELRFRAFLLQNPGYPGAHVNLAILMATKGDDAAAAQHIRDALRLDPEHPAALNQLGMLERRNGRFLEAESAYMKAVTASPDYALAHYNLGVLNELYLQRLDTALAHFERYLEVGGDDELVTKWVADLKRRIGTYERTANVTE
jgi:tetratricopeptide (TPR) repeat protein